MMLHWNSVALFAVPTGLGLCPPQSTSALSRNWHFTARFFILEIKSSTGSCGSCRIPCIVYQYSMDTVTRLWLQLVLEFSECPAVVHIAPFFSRPENNIANFLFVVGVFEQLLNIN